MNQQAAASRPPSTLADVLEELRALAAQDAPGTLSVERVLAATITLVKSEPRHAPLVLRKCMPLVMHATTHVQRAAADGVLKLLDVAASLPDDVVDEAMPVLAQLLDFSIGKWSFAQSTYRFARFPRLRQRILDAALEMAVAERNHTNPAVAVMALHDVMQGLQKCNAFDAPQVAEAFARYALRQSNAEVQRAVIAYLIEEAPHVVTRVLDARPELFPFVEDLHVYRSEQRGHLVDARPHEKRVAGLGQLPVAHIERLLRDDEARAPAAQRMAAALAVPHIADQAARARLLPALRRMLDEDGEASRHVGVVEGERGSPEHFWTHTVALPPLTLALQSLDRHDPSLSALALDALRVATPHNVASTLLPLARVCDRAAAAAWLTSVVANTDRAFSAAVRWIAFDVLCAVSDDDVTDASAALARDIEASTPDERKLVHGLHARFPELFERDGHGPARFAALLRVWPATMGHTDVPHNLRLASYRALERSKHAHADALATVRADAKRVLQETAKIDKPLAEALLIAPL